MHMPGTGLWAWVGGLFYNRLYSLEQFYVPSKIGWEVQRFPIQPHTCRASPTTDTPTRAVHWLQSVSLRWPTIITRDCWCIWWSLLRNVLSVRADVTRIHHYGIIQSIFTALKILCALPTHPSWYPPTSPPLESTDFGFFFTISIVLPFPECPIVGITQCVAFADWLHLALYI